MSDSVYQSDPNAISRHENLRVVACGDIEARLEAAVAANPHCPNNMFLRRRALVVGQGPSGGPEAYVILRSSIWPQAPYGPVVGFCRSSQGAEEKQFETSLFVLGQMAEGYNGIFALDQLHGELKRSTTIRAAQRDGAVKFSTFEDAIQALCDDVAGFAGQITGGIETNNLTLEATVHAD